jgi:hypothetical protein
MNIRGKLLIENCHMEAPGDDCLNFATLLEKIGDYSPDIPKAMTLNTTDNRYYYHNILKGDALQVLDTKANRFIGVANVEKVEFIAQRRSHRVLLNRALPALVAANVVVINLNRMTLSTVIRNNLKTPYMRNAMLVRVQNMTIESDKIDGPHGGVMGVNFTYSMGESARMRNVNITGNTFSGFQSSAIIMGNACRNQQGVLIVQDFPITNNMFQLGPLWAVVDLDEYDPRYDVSVDRAQGCFEAMPRTRCRKNDGPEKIACTASTQYDGVLVFEQFRKMIAAMLTNLMLVFSAH